MSSIYRSEVNILYILPVPSRFDIILVKSASHSVRVGPLRGTPQVLQTARALHDASGSADGPTSAVAGASAVAFVAVGAAFGVTGAVAKVAFVVFSGKFKVTSQYMKIILSI